jgi:hypothetical protein
MQKQIGDVVYEKIKFSNIRGVFLYINYLFNIVLNKLRIRKDFWFLSFKKEDRRESENKILLFCPSLNLDKPSYITVGIKALINTAKFNGLRVDYIQCIGALQICHLGGSPFSFNNSMPCNVCKKINHKIFDDTNKINFEKFDKTRKDFSKFNIAELQNYVYKDYSLGKLVTSSIIWIKRSSEVNESFRGYYEKMLNDAINLVEFFSKKDLSVYKGILVFNGASFPEAVLYEMCKIKELNVATFEGGLSYENKYCIEFNYGITSQHKFYFDNSLDSKSDKLAISNVASHIQNQWVDGINVKDGYFGQNTDLGLNNKKIVSIFGNVSWDTSQYISNSIFESMYDWTDSLIKIIKDFPEYEFVFRAHPGENRSLKETYFGLSDWFELNVAGKYRNVTCIPADNKTNSYDLISKSEIVLVYNSTIGIEAAMLGKKTFVAANTHYSKQPFVKNYYQKDLYLEKLHSELKKETHSISKDLSNMAKAYYYQLFNNVSYPLDEFIIKSNNRYLEVDIEKLDNKEFLLKSQFNVLLKSFLNKENIQFKS